MTNGIRKISLGVNIFDKRILDSCKFILNTVLQNTTYLDSIFYVSIFIVSGKREEEEKHRETPPSLHYYFLISGKREGEKKHRETPSSLHYYFLFFQVGCTTMLFITGFCSATRNW